MDVSRGEKYDALLAGHQIRNPDVIRNGIAKPMQGVDKIHCYKTLAQMKKRPGMVGNAQRPDTDTRIVLVVLFCAGRLPYQMLGCIFVSQVTLVHLWQVLYPLGKGDIAFVRAKPSAPSC